MLKKLLIVCVATVLSLLWTTFSFAGYIPMTHRYGDINHDGEINSTDLVLLRRHILGISEIKDSYGKIAADINGDDVLDSIDYILMRRAVLGMIRIGGGTFYGTDGSGGNSSFDAAIPINGIYYVAAMNTYDYGNSEISGACVEATGPDGTVRVIITDRLPEGNPGDIDFSESVFPLIANPILGRVPIYWRIVEADVEGPVIYHFKIGSNPYWTAVQIRNHRYPIAKFEYLNSEGEFEEVPREYYNYFVKESGMGRGPFTFRITDMYGQTLIDEDIELIETTNIPGKSQFPLRP
ncbi:UNVERIFIED_CONTAM: expansin (peptidoglycan-binding protein) [Acetivibrio alkalicellulosi]